MKKVMKQKQPDKQKRRSERMGAYPIRSRGFVSIYYGVDKIGGIRWI